MRYVIVPGKSTVFLQESNQSYWSLYHLISYPSGFQGFFCALFDVPARPRDIIAMIMDLVLGPRGPTRWKELTDLPIIPSFPASEP